MFGVQVPYIAVSDVRGYAIAEQFFIKQLAHQSRIGPANFAPRADKGLRAGAAYKSFSEGIVTCEATGGKNGFSPKIARQ